MSIMLQHGSHGRSRMRVSGLRLAVSAREESARIARVGRIGRRVVGGKHLHGLAIVQPQRTTLIVGPYVVEIKYLIQSELNGIQLLLRKPPFGPSMMNLNVQRDNPRSSLGEWTEMACR